MARVAVTGGSNFDDSRFVNYHLSRLDDEYFFECLIHGNAPGADKLCGEWAKSKNIKVISVDANWERYGKAAGPIRNKEILKYKPDILISFPGGRGTNNMISEARKLGVTHIECT